MTARDAAGQRQGQGGDRRLLCVTDWAETLTAQPRAGQTGRVEPEAGHDLDMGDCGQGPCSVLWVLGAQSRGLGSLA